MLGMNDVKKGNMIILDGDPVKVLSIAHTKVGRQGATVTIKYKNLKTGSALERTLRPADKFIEAEIDKKTMRFEFAHRGQVTFVNPENPAERMIIPENDVADALPYLPSKMNTTLLYFNDEIIGVELPPKVDLNVTMAPPSVRGNTADGGTKQVETETGLTVSTPLFIETGDVIKVNTETGHYVERVKKV